MAVLRAQAEVISETGRVLGTGMAYLHLPRGTDREQDCTGTASLRTWAPGEERPLELRLEDGRRLPIEVDRDALSECSRNRVLRFRLRWPGASRTNV